MAGEVPHELDERSWLYRPSFPDEWERMSLLSMARWVNGLAFRDFQFSDTGKPVIKIAEIKGGITGQTKFTNQTFEKSVFVTNGDMLFSWSGQPETSIDVFWWRGRDGWLNQHIFKVTPIEELDPVFFFYVLRYLKPNFIGIARNKQTTGLGHVTRRDIENIEAAFPPLAEQKAIAAVLGALDAKIELNRRMNATLEAMARALFQSWFIDFDPVRANMDRNQPSPKPSPTGRGSQNDNLPSPPGRRAGDEGRFALDPDIAALFPDSFQDSELGRIPKGWRVGRVAEMSDFSRESINPGNFRKEIFDHYSLPAFDQGRTPKVELGSAIMSNKLVVTRNSVLLSKLNPHIPRIWLPELHESRRSVCSTEFIVASTRSGFSREFLFSLFTSAAFASIYGTLVTGTTGSHQRIRADSVLEMKTVIPPSRLIEAFTAIAKPMFDQINRNTDQSRTLATLRDTLLPKLLSGELSVGEVEKEVSA